MVPLWDPSFGARDAAVGWLRRERGLAYAGGIAALEERLLTVWLPCAVGGGFAIPAREDACA